MYKVLISGYYGFNNIGDEAILKGLIEGISGRLPSVDMVVLSKYPDFTAKKHNVRAVNRIHLFKILREMRSMDVLVSGGGSLLQDVTSKRSIAYYLGLIWLAKRVFRKKVMIYSQGIGPVTQKFNRLLVEKILGSVDIINVRDEKSKQELIDIGIKKQILVTTDTVFSIQKPSLDKGSQILGKMDRKGGRPYVGISVRYWKNCSERVRIETAKLCTRILRESGYRPVLIPFHFHRDLQLMREIHDCLPEEIREEVLIMEQYLYVDDYLSLIGNMDLMVAMRLHGLIFAALMQVCPIGISYDPKIESFMKILGEEEVMQVREMDADRLFAHLLRIMDTLGENKERLKTRLESIRSSASRHNDLLVDLLEN